jgi:Uma2 family endonuclease
MSAIASSSTPFLGMTALRRFTVQEYHRMIDAGVLTDEDKVELLNGYVVLKMPRNPRHDNTILKFAEDLFPLVRSSWVVRNQSAVTLARSEPEPDISIARGDRNSYQNRHPSPADLGLVIEVSDSTLARDRGEKLGIYADAALPVYWIVNLVDQQVEVYTLPSGPVTNPDYGQHQIYQVGDSVPVILDGAKVGEIPVADLLS